MNTSDGNCYGSLLFFRKDGSPGSSYNLHNGQIQIGASKTADIRLRIGDQRLEEVHCIINVTEDGIATLLNKSASTPVGVNNILIKKMKMLCNEDIIDVVGKKIKYLNNKFTEVDVNKKQKLINKIIISPKKRQSALPAVKAYSSKKTRVSTRKESIGCRSSKFEVSATPENKLGKFILTEKSKTTSKIVTSKALASTAKLGRRRLSLGSNSKKADEFLKVSSRNILLSRNSSSTISEEQSSPSFSAHNIDNLVTNFVDTTSISLSSSGTSMKEESVKKTTFMRTPVKTPTSKTVLMHGEMKTSKVKTPSGNFNLSVPTMANNLTPKTISTPGKVEKPEMSPSNNLNSPAKRRVMTPRNTPLHKRLTSLKATPGSVKKSTPLNRLSPKLVDSLKKTPKKSVNLIDFDDITSTPQLSRLEISGNLSCRISKKESASSSNLSLQKTPKKSINLIDFYVDPSTPPDSQAGRNIDAQLSSKKAIRKASSTSVELNNSNQKISPMKTSSMEVNEQSSMQCTPQNGSGKKLRLSTATKSKLASIDSDDISDSSVVLNLSSTSSYSPIPPREVLPSTDSDIVNDPRYTLGKASPRKSTRLSQQKEETLTRVSSRSSVRNKRESELKRVSLSEDSEGMNILHEDKPARYSNAPNIRSSSSRRFSSRNKSCEINNQSPNQNSVMSNTYLIEDDADNNELLQNESSLSSTSSNEEYLDAVEPESVNKSRQSLRRNFENENEEVESKVQAIFAPKCRPSIKRSYISAGTAANEKCSSFNRNTNFTDNFVNISTASNSDSPSIRRSRRKSVNTSCKSCDISPVNKSTPHHNGSYGDQSISSESSMLSSIDGELRTYSNETTKNVLFESYSEEESVAEARISSKSERSLTRISSTVNRSRRSSLVESKDRISVITIDDSVKNTPENHKSVIILDTPFEKESRKSHKKLSKTRNSSIEDSVELTTPKSAIKSRRSKSLPYAPVVEEITPVTPLESSSKTESAFKTPLNTPGLFENIKKSAMRSRTRRKSSNNLMEELNKAVKRKRESEGTTDRSAKKGKILSESMLNSVDENFDASFASFGTDEVFEDTSEQDLDHETSQDFKNLMDKPVINNLQSQSLLEYKRRRSTRRFSHAPRLESEYSESNNCSGSIFSNESDVIDTDSNASSRRSSLRLSSRADDAEIVQKIPKNDLDVFKKSNTRKTPKPVLSPKNDLTNIVGVKKLFSTPSVVKSPKNDLTQIPNLRKMMYPKQQNSPRNDLSDVAGLKKLLSTPKVQNSPKNDLTKVPNLRKFMSPKQQNSPRNDLSNVKGLKRLMKTPRKQKEPLNDLSNVEGVADIFSAHEFYMNENGTENNENLFDKLFVNKPIRTYRGKSLSPLSRKAMLYPSDNRKSVGDTPFTSPRIEKWLEDQAVVSLETVDDDKSDVIGPAEKIEAIKAEEQDRVTPRGRKKKTTLNSAEQEKIKTKGNKSKVEDKAETPKKAARGRRTAKTIKIEEEGNSSPADSEIVKKPRGYRTNQLEIAKSNSVRATRTRHLEAVPSSEDESNTNLQFKLPLPIKQGNISEQISKFPNTTSEEKPEEVEALKTSNSEKVSGKRRRNEPIEHDSIKEESAPKVTRRGRKKAVELQSKKDKDAATTDSEEAPTNRAGVVSRDEKLEDDTSDEAHIKTRRGRTKSVKINDNKTEGQESTEDAEVPVIKRRYRGRHASHEEKNTSLDTSEDVLPTKRVRRGKKSPAKVQKDSKNDVDSETASAKRDEDNSGIDTSAPRRRGRRAAAVADESDDAKIEVVEKPIKKSNRRKLLTDEEVENTEKEASMSGTPTKKTRGRPKLVQKGVEVITEGNNDVIEAPKKFTRGMKTTSDEETVKIETTSNKTRGRKALPKGKLDKAEETEDSAKSKSKKQKILIEVTEQVQDSPRTRQRKGNFKKYGSDFITEEEHSIKPKSVHFSQDVDKPASMKRKDKENEEAPLRRSKRNLK